MVMSTDLAKQIPQIKIPDQTIFYCWAGIRTVDSLYASRTLQTVGHQCPNILLFEEWPSSLIRHYKGAQNIKPL